MYNSINFKIYVIEESERRQLETAVVENISFRANDINTATFSMIVNSLEAEDLPQIGTRVLIYAEGMRAKGNDFSDNFLNKTLDEYNQYQNSNSFGDYTLLVFAGEIKSIDTTVETNMFSSHFILRYTFNCEGIETILQSLGFNSYKFYDPISQQIITVAGIPIFENNSYLHNNQRVFTTNGYGDRWTRFHALTYLQQNIVSPYSDVIISFHISNTTLQSLADIDMPNNIILSHYDYINKVCGQLFSSYFYYSEDNDNNIILHVKIVSKVSNDNDDTVSFLNLHGTKIVAENIKPHERLVLRYPFYATLDGIYKIFRSADNIAGDDYYVYDVNKVSDDTDIESVHNLTYKAKGDNLTEAPPIPYLVDYELKHSVGSQMGCHSKFILHPITSLLINGAPILVNIEDFEVVELNSFNRVTYANNEPIILDWISDRPFKDMTISLEGNEVTIDCDIPHQVAPSNFTVPHSIITEPVFPINDGSDVYVNATVRAKNNREYVSVGSGIDTRIIDVDFVPSNPLALANYINSLISNVTSRFALDGTLLDWLIDYFFCFGHNLKYCYLLVIDENNPYTDTIEVFLPVTGFEIRRSGAHYDFSVNANKGSIDINELLEQLRNRYEMIISKRNTLTIKGNYDDVFHGRIIEVKDNHYVVAPAWNEALRIPVARIDEHKVGYWLNNKPSDKVEFRLVGNEEEHKMSERYEDITTDEGVVRKYNKIVPDELMFNIIQIKVSCGNVHCVIDDEMLGKFYAVYLDNNQYARSWAVVPDDEDNIYG